MISGPVVTSSQLSAQRLKNSKRRKILLAFVLLSASVLLAIGLQGLALKASVPVRLAQDSNTGPASPFFSWTQAFMVLAFLLLSFLLLLLIPPSYRKWGVAVLFIISIFLLFTYFSPAPLIKENPSALQTVETPPAVDENFEQPLDSADEFPPSEEFHPPQVASWFLYLISLSLILSFVLIVWMVYHWRKSQPAPIVLPPLEEIGEAARLALDDLAAGVDERDAVIHCYVRMSDIVQHSRNIERGASRTATEFASRLEAAGLPGDSVRRLTRLFESVRYGARVSGLDEIEEAKECLTDIARFCGEKL